MNLASLLAKRTFRVKGRNHVWCLTSLLPIILLPKTDIFISESGKLGNYWRQKSGLKKTKHHHPKQSTDITLSGSWKLILNPAWSWRKKLSVFPLKTPLPPIIFLTFCSSPLVSTRQWENESQTQSLWTHCCTLCKSTVCVWVHPHTHTTFVYM